MIKPKWARDPVSKSKQITVNNYRPTKLMSEKKREDILKEFDEIQRIKELKKAKKQERINIMKELRAKGFTLQEIGDEFGITRERVRQLVS